MKFVAAVYIHSKLELINVLSIHEHLVEMMFVALTCMQNIVINIVCHMLFKYFHKEISVMWLYNYGNN